MKIEVKLGVLADVMCEYADLFSDAEYITAEEDEDIMVTIVDFPIYIPELKIILRSGYIWRKQSDDNDVDASVVLIYDINESNNVNYLNWITDDYQGAVYSFFYPKYNLRDLDDIQCILDMTNISEDENLANELMEFCKDRDAAYKELLHRNKA